MFARVSLTSIVIPHLPTGDTLKSDGPPATNIASDPSDRQVRWVTRPDWAVRDLGRVPSATALEEACFPTVVLGLQPDFRTSGPIPPDPNGRKASERPDYRLGTDERHRLRHLRAP